MAGAAVTCAVCAVLFLVSCALCLAIRYAHRPPPLAPVTLQTLLAGVHYVWGHKVVLGVVSLDLFAVLLGGVGRLLVAALWLRLFPSLAQRDGLVQAPGNDTRY